MIYRYDKSKISYISTSDTDLRKVLLGVHRLVSQAVKDRGRRFFFRVNFIFGIGEERIKPL